MKTSLKRFSAATLRRTKAFRQKPFHIRRKSARLRQLKLQSRAFSFRSFPEQTASMTAQEPCATQEPSRKSLLSTTVRQRRSAKALKRLQKALKKPRLSSFPADFPAATSRTAAENLLPRSSATLRSKSRFPLCLSSATGSCAESATVFRLL